MNIIIEELKARLVEGQQVEVVERKGIGHPDTISDAVCEAVSNALSRYYTKHFGVVLHHNVDKALLIGGRSTPKFGGGKIDRKIKLIIAGRITDSVGTRKIPVDRIAIKAAKNVLSKVLPNYLSVDDVFDISLYYEPGAENLKQVFKAKGKVGIANDTSFGVAFAPLSRTEKVVLEIANFLNSQAIRRKYRFIGTDVKVMGLRKKNKVRIIFSVAYIDKHIKSPQDYFKKKEIIKREVEKIVKKYFSSYEIYHNTLDNPKAKDENEIYLTVSGLSAEHGDDGQVGRGNRVNGLITPSREMSMEAAAGKNIRHPGKLYQIMAHIIANRIAKIKGVKECYVEILSRIGYPLDKPEVVYIKLIAENFNYVQEKAKKITEELFHNLYNIQKQIILGRYKPY